MAQHRFSSLSSRSLSSSLVAIGSVFIICLVLSLGQVFLITLNPIIGLIGMVAIALIILFFIRPELALPLYILVAAPTVVLSASSSGIFARLYIGDLLFVLIVGIWLLRDMLSKSKMRLARRETRILIPL